MATEHYDAIIIGAGMSGLAAGIRLAHFEKKVCLLERHSLPGGLNSFYRLGGRNFDVGLHALTNFVPKELRSAPLNKLLRQLRLRHEDFALCPQTFSEIRFPGVALRFDNGFALFESEVCEKFPRQADGFHKLVAHVRGYNDVGLDAAPVSARKVLGEFLDDPLLIDMLCCPLMYYGNAQADDMEFGQFCIMFKSIFCEGFSRPRSGVRQIINALLNKYKESGGELRLKSGVRALKVARERVAAVELDDGTELTAATVFSSAGYVETMLLCSDLAPAARTELSRQAGQMTFFESISILDRQPAEIGLKTSIVFFNNSERFRYRPAAEPLDLSSGVLCCPNNFQHPEPLEDGIVRATHIANHEHWMNLPEDAYQAQKRLWHERSLETLATVAPSFKPFVKFTDTFTPRTIRKFTGHINGTVYGAPEKHRSGRTRVHNLFICGTDQGFLGISGAMLSGISMANLHGLKGNPA